MNLKTYSRPNDVLHANKKTCQHTYSRRAGLYGMYSAEYIPATFKPQNEYYDIYLSVVCPLTIPTATIIS